ncbi:MAG: UDP-N-acetylmuramate dehydrogenase [Acidobacteriota bacterium]
MRIPATVTRNQPLASFTTLELGGPAEFFCQPLTQQELKEVCAWAKVAGLPVTVLAGGSNVVIADGGVSGLVLRVAWQGLEVEKREETVTVIAQAGTPLDEVVALSVAEGWAGLECLSGIPGSVGATPVQNVGAYGQEVAECILWVEVFHREHLTFQRVPCEACGFAYRSSIFRGQRQWIITRVAFRLWPQGAPTLRYPELAELFRGSARPSLAEVRQAVLSLRQKKGMVLTPGLPESRTVGSFFKNPVLSFEAFERLKIRLWEQGVLPFPQEPPNFAVPAGIKVPAAWLVEQAGFPKGTRRGPVGVSPLHALSLVHWGGGTAEALVALASEIQRAVKQAFGITLEPEPVFLGFSQDLRLARATCL